MNDEDTSAWPICNVLEYSIESKVHQFIHASQRPKVGAGLAIERRCFGLWLLVSKLLYTKMHQTEIDCENFTTVITWVSCLLANSKEDRTPRR